MPNADASRAVAAPARSGPLRIGIALFRGAEELDWAGPWEVFAYWSSRWPDEAEVFTVADTFDPVRSARGLRLLPDRTWSMCPLLDVLVCPGGRGVREQLEDPCVVDRLRELKGRGVLLASVSSGALVLAAAGLLDDRPATSHRWALDDLRLLGSRIDVRSGDRVVDAGDVVTAAGTSAGIDLALTLVERLHSAGRADAVREAIEYACAPATV